jgi:hypothetical protein
MILKGASNMNRKIFYPSVLLCWAVLALAIAGWAKDYHMTASNIVPGASAELNVSKEKDGNVRFNLKVRHLAKPGRLTPPANTYVVWLQQEGSEPQSQGELKIGDNLKGELKGATPLHNFKVFVTTETDGQTKFPSEQVVLRARVQE